MSGSKETNLHAGHRARLRRRFLEEGLDGFEHHRVLELLLFFAIPRRDTNELAHMLLHRYGSFSGVFDADPKDLSDSEGIGESAATLLSIAVRHDLRESHLPFVHQPLPCASSRHDPATGQPVQIGAASPDSEVVIS